jgi:hypothetical protein
VGFNFPDAPTVGQVFPPFQWDGEKWFLQVKPSKGEALVTVSDTPPVGPVDGQFWWQSTTGVLFLRFNDGSSSQWVVATPTPDITTITTKSYVDVGDAASKAYTDAGDVAAKAYTDAGDAAAKLYTDAGDASVLATTGSTVKYTPQALTAPQQAIARANINVSPAPPPSKIINGAMMISQENGSTAGSAVPYYPVDMFPVYNGSGAAVSIQQVASLTPGGSPNRIRVTINTADAAVAVADYIQILQYIEGQRMADLMMGTTNAKTFTLRFGTRSPAGTYCVAFKNGASNRAYIVEYVITAGEANTDVVRTITVPGDQAGTWAINNTAGMMVNWGLMFGTNYQGVANTWQAGNQYATPNQFNFAGTAGNVFELFDVWLGEGSAAPNYIVPEFSSEKWLCRRYYQSQVSASAMWMHPIDVASQYRRRWIEFHPEMRIAPVMTVVGGQTGTPAGAITVNQISSMNAEAWGDGTPTTSYSYFSSFKASARL